MKSVEETLRERRKVHGDFSARSEIVYNLWKVINNFEITYTYVEEEALRMIVEKLSRIVCGDPHKPDHWHDIAGYATLVERELRGEERDEESN